jgi:dTDP-4-dehydrorhamnose 3,5-epimerase
VQVIDLPLEGLKLLRPQIFRDERGFLLESYQRARYRAAGVECEFVQNNHSESRLGTLHGLHYRSKPGQAKLVRCTRGRIFDVAVDIRPNSVTFGRWHGTLLDDVSHEQIFIPIGFAHGFCVLSDVAGVQYKVSAPYDAGPMSAPSRGTIRTSPWPGLSRIFSSQSVTGRSSASQRFGRVGKTYPGEFRHSHFAGAGYVIQLRVAHE